MHDTVVFGKSMNENRKRFKRGRRPGVKLSEYEKPNPNDRPHLGRFSVTMPITLARMVRSLKPQLDLEYSKIFPKGVVEVGRMSFEKGLISRKLYDQYWAERRLFKDEDWSG